MFGPEPKQSAEHVDIVFCCGWMHLNSMFRQGSSSDLGVSRSRILRFLSFLPSLRADARIHLQNK